MLDFLFDFNHCSNTLFGTSLFFYSFHVNHFTLYVCKFIHYFIYFCLDIHILVLNGVNVLLLLKETLHKKKLIYSLRWL